MQLLAASLASFFVPTIAVYMGHMFVMETRTVWMALMKKTVVGYVTSNIWVFPLNIYKISILFFALNRVLMWKLAVCMCQWRPVCESELPL